MNHHSSTFKYYTILEYGGKGEEYCKIKEICGVGIPKHGKERAPFLNCMYTTQGVFFLTNLKLLMSNKKASEESFVHKG